MIDVNMREGKRMQGDVSFTFLDRIEEVELNIVDRRWQSALALALTLPDICGGIAFPEIVKHYRDGRVMLDRQKNPTRDVGTQYIRWFDEYAGDYFKLSQSDQKPYICGERCWQLRCEYLHQNKAVQIIRLQNRLPGKVMRKIPKLYQTEYL